MQVVSVNVGLPRDVVWRGQSVRTGIFKQPAAGKRLVRGFNLEGDGQADLTVHGGRDKAVYAYPSEHYAFWRTEWPREDYPWGLFGENLSTAGLLEDRVCVGDQFRIGTATLVVTQPRLPCYKLGIRFGDPAIIERFLQSRRPGIYFAVVEEGELGAGDRIELLSADPNRLNLVELLDLMVDPEPTETEIRRALSVRALAESWRQEFTNRLG